jgi:hypothetical protein
MKTPVISMYGPWANWVGLGWKTIETRTHDRFKSLVGKRIGIHKALKWDKDALVLAHPYLSNDQRERTMRFLRVGGAICWTALVKEHRALNESDSQAALIDCGETNRFGMFLEDVQMIEMIPCKGKQGIWYYDITQN